MLLQEKRGLCTDDIQRRLLLSLSATNDLFFDTCAEVSDGPEVEKNLGKAPVETFGAIWLRLAALQRSRINSSLVCIIVVASFL
jgi:hypothetical protein